MKASLHVWGKFFDPKILLGERSVDRDNMGQDAQIIWNRLDSLKVGQFPKKKCLVFKDLSVRNHVPNFLVKVPFLECKKVTFQGCVAKSNVTFLLLILLS